MFLLEVPSEHVKAYARAVEYHFGNVQVKYYDAFAHKTEWEELTQFKRSLERKEG